MQEIANIRVDVRLIHGQVAAMWVNTLKVTRIMVVDRLAAKDEMLKKVLKMACPTGVKLSILPPEKAAFNLNENKYSEDRIMIVVKGPASLLELYECGFRFDTVNVGNMASSMETKMIKKSVHCNEQNIKDFNKLHEYGVKFTAQMYPGEEYFDFIGAINKL